METEGEAQEKKKKRLRYSVSTRLVEQTKGGRRKEEAKEKKAERLRCTQ